MTTAYAEVMSDRMLKSVCKRIDLLERRLPAHIFNRLVDMVAEAGFNYIIQEYRLTISQVLSANRVIVAWLRSN